MMSSLFRLMVKKSLAYFWKIWTITFHPNVKCFHETKKENIHFLDLNGRLSDGSISTDLYVKPTGSYQFLQYTSSHPDHTKHSIVFIQALRVCRIRSKKSDFVKPLEKMKSWFLVRGYPKKLIESEMKKVKFTSKNRNIKRGKLLKVISFITTYHPKLKSMNKVVLKYFDLLYMGNEVKRVFIPKSMI